MLSPNGSMNVAISATPAVRGGVDSFKAHVKTKMKDCLSYFKLYIFLLHIFRCIWMCTLTHAMVFWPFQYCDQV